LLTSTKEEITIFTPLSGRTEYWARFRDFLETVDFPHERLRLVFLDTSRSEPFGRMVKDWLITSDFRKIIYIKKNVGPAGLADIRRVGADRSVNLDLNFQIHHAMCTIYNTMRDVVKTSLVWVIEDDIIPPTNALKLLLSDMTPDTFSVSGTYKHRYQPSKIVAWDFDDSLLCVGNGLQKVKGNGFGCVLLRMGAVRQHVFTPDKKWPDFDRAFYHRAPSAQCSIINWNIDCDHLSPTYSVQPCSNPYESNISASNFCESDYLRRYRDVKKAIFLGQVESAYHHYVKYGKPEGRIAIPNTPFDEDYYLSLYPDVATAIKKGSLKDGLEHYILYGQKEGRYSRAVQEESKAFKSKVVNYRTQSSSGRYES